MGAWVGELGRAWRAVVPEQSDGRLIVDLTDVTFVGEEGKKLLETMYAEGAKLKASGCVTRKLVEEIGLSFNRRHPKQVVTNPQ
jgi:anti-anti-sigma regulatory factor